MFGLDRILGHAVKDAAKDAFPSPSSIKPPKIRGATYEIKAASAMAYQRGYRVPGQFENVVQPYIAKSHPALPQTLPALAGRADSALEHLKTLPSAHSSLESFREPAAALRQSSTRSVPDEITTALSKLENAQPAKSQAEARVLRKNIEENTEILKNI